MSEPVTPTAAAQHVDTFLNRITEIRRTLHQVVVGQEDTIDLLMICALTGSHALLVGVPGLAKTLMVKALASAFRWKFSRIQFTPDLMPADITGYDILGRESDGGGARMVFRPGPMPAHLRFTTRQRYCAAHTHSPNDVLVVAQ